MKSPFHNHVVALMLLLLGASGLIGCSANSRSQEESEMPIAGRLRLAQQDEERLKKLQRATSSKPRNFFGPEFFYRTSGLTFESERMITEGRELSPQLKQAVVAPELAAELKYQALLVLAYIEPEYAVDNALKLRKVGTLTRLQCSEVCERSLPFSIELIRAFNDRRADDMLRLELDGGGFSNVGLRRLDERLSSNGDPLNKPRVPDVSLMRWLNRIWSTDIDKVLADRAPSLLQFRNRELRKGYDPLTAFPHLRGFFYDGELGWAASKIFKDPRDAEQFCALYEQLHGQRSQPDLRSAEWWDELRQWYGENRAHLQWSRTLSRYSVR